MQKSFKPDQAFMNNVEKLQTAFLSMENYHCDILIMYTYYPGVFGVRKSKINK